MDGNIQYIVAIYIISIYDSVHAICSVNVKGIIYLAGKMSNGPSPQRFPLFNWSIPNGCIVILSSAPQSQTKGVNSHLAIVCVLSATAWFFENTIIFIYNKAAL